MTFCRRTRNCTYRSHTARSVNNAYEQSGTRRLGHLLVVHSEPGVLCCLVVHILQEHTFLLRDPTTGCSVSVYHNS